MKTEKVFFTIAGLIVALAGLAIFWKSLESVIIAIIFFLGGFMLLTAVGWSKLKDGSTDFSDLSSIITLVLALFAFLSGIFVLISATTPDWIGIPAVVAMVIIGLDIIWTGVKK